MLKIGDKVKVHMYSCGREVKTINYDKVFNVCGSPENMGIEWNIERSPYTCKGELFNSFYTFAGYAGGNGVIFENIETGEKYHFSSIKNGLEKIVL